MNYVAIKESVLRRCSLVIAGGTSFHNEYYVAVRVCEGRQQIEGNFTVPNKFFLTENISLFDAKLRNGSFFKQLFIIWVLRAIITNITLLLLIKLKNPPFSRHFFNAIYLLYLHSYIFCSTKHKK